MHHSFRLLALDIDGTLLDSRGELRQRTIRAIAHASEAGIRSVLCTGRRFRRARPIGEALGLNAPLVCNSGAVVKEPISGRTLWRADFPAELLISILQVFQDRGENVIGFSDRENEDWDFVASRKSTDCEHFDQFVRMNLSHARIDSDWTTRDDPHFHICAIGNRSNMLDAESAILDRLGDRVRTFVQKSPAYSGTMCEVLRADASKWSAVMHVADLWGILPSEICAIGDDMNDLPMIEGAGFGVAMAHAPESVRDAADHVTLGNDEDGVALFIEEMLLRI